MKKYYLISIFLLISAASVTAQNVVNADKSYQPTTRSSTVNISAAAVLNGGPTTDDINSVNYHQVVPVNSVTQEKVATHTVVEVTLVAQDPEVVRENTVKKEAVISVPVNRNSDVISKPKVIERSVTAIKQ